MWTEELVFGRRKERTSESRLNKFLGGRIALRRALQQLNRGNVPPILRDHYGAPELPADITGSISHKDDLAVGVAALDTRGRVGVDIERCTNKSAFQLQRRILTEGEKQRLGQLPTVSEEEEVLLRFSFKEAVYKAIHPVLQRSVEFTEVETDPLADGTAKLTFLLKTGEVFRYHASWQRYHDNYWLTCVYIHFD
jgi:4'-phosphopantetheinyl transferase EntD